jgi:outer membrane protein insertion porin family
LQLEEDRLRKSYYGLKSTLVILLLFFGVFRSFGQQSQLGTILGLTVSGNKTSDASVVRMSSGLREGQQITIEEIQKAVRQLWNLGIFSDIRILVDRRTSEGIYLTIQVGEYPRLEKVDIEGNKKLKSDEIEKEMGFIRGQIINPTQVFNAKKAVKKKYAEKGYILADIQIESYESEKEGKTVLKVSIDEGKKVQVEKIQFFGNTVFKDRMLRKKMKKTKEDRWWRGADFDREEYLEDKENVLTFYRNNGYRDVEIYKDSLYYDEAFKDIFIDIWINEGRCYYVGKISWEGNELFSDKALESMLEFGEGDVLGEEKLVKSIRDNIGAAYSDLGYIFAQVNPRETLRGDNILDLHFIIEERNAVTIRKINVAGNTRTKEKVIRRALRIRPGDIFNRELLERSFRELSMLNYFSNIEPNWFPVNEEQMDIAFKVEEKSTDTAQISAGWSELDKLIGSIGLGMNNLFGNGQQLSLDWNFGRFYRSFRISFTEPWFLNTETLVGASVYDTKRDAYYIGYSQRSRGISLRFGKRFAWPDNYFRGDWYYRFDQTELGDFSSYYIKYNPNNIINEPWPLTTSSITQVISRNSLDQPEFPTRGSMVSLSTELAGGPLGGNVAYHKHIFSAEFFFPTISNKLVVLTRATFGFMDHLTSSGRIPYTSYFFMGGSGLSASIPLRGYDDPLAGGGIRTWGGKTMLKTTVEFRFPIITNPMAFGLIFAEAGNTWLDIENTDPFNLRRSVGIGARIFMPMLGMLGFDYAYGFDNEAYGRKYGAWKPHFVFGRSF